jgi:glycosyltransferase involved in cell wall biosynthesis
MAGSHRMTDVIALIPHLGRDAVSDAWLGQAVESLLAQTVPLQAIVVVDDASPHPPDALVARHPEVSLYRNDRNTGPFAISETVFARTHADAVLLQDSDDWSTPDRLQRLLARFETGFELVGGQVDHVPEPGQPNEGPDLAALPLDPLAALLQRPTAHTLLLTSGLVSVALARRLGGFASGMRINGDSEFVRRAVFGGRVCNIAETVYVRRLHASSLTRAPETGFGSPVRNAAQLLVQARARLLVEDYVAGNPLDLAPMQTGQAARLTHVLGPRVAGL